jgi:exopolyphosphatase/pppGpp-phosphohydrolase
VSIDLLNETEELLSPELTERVDPETEPEAAAAEPIGRFGLLSEELSGGAGAMYLREIAHHELLTAQEEVSLAQRLEGGKAALRELATADETLDAARRTELERLAEDVRRLIDTELEGRVIARAREGIAVAGTPTSLAAIDLALDPYDPEVVQGHRLTLAAIQRMCSELAAVPLAERLKVTGLHPDRAPTIVAGVVILIQAMRAFGLSEIEVSEHDILHGAALEESRAVA